MLIITADDYGISQRATDAILCCFSKRRITSASAMVFMKDSDRAAQLAARTGLEIGLHLNFTVPFTSETIPQQFTAWQKRVSTYLNKNRFTQIFYNPFLTNLFSALFSAQENEFIRLYGRKPDFYNGHHHMHLCTNILFPHFIPKGSKIRRSFTFGFGDKHPFNYCYRYMLNIFLSHHFVTTEEFYSLAPKEQLNSNSCYMMQAIKRNIEIEVHPEHIEQLQFLLSDKYRRILDTIPIGRFHDLY